MGMGDGGVGCRVEGVVVWGGGCLWCFSVPWQVTYFMRLGRHGIVRQERGEDQ
jgi:hypothetical protein